jgi:hypothetical protein
VGCKNGKLAQRERNINNSTFVVYFGCKMKNNSQNKGERKSVHNRRSIRLKGYDYSKPGAYFITICCDERKCRFGNIVGAGFTSAPNIDNRTTARVAPTSASISPAMQLNEYGTIAYNEWVKLPERFPNANWMYFK